MWVVELGVQRPWRWVWGIRPGLGRWGCLRMSMWPLTHTHPSLSSAKKKKRDDGIREHMTGCARSEASIPSTRRTSSDTSTAVVPAPTEPPTDTQVGPPGAHPPRPPRLGNGPGPSWKGCQAARAVVEPEDPAHSACGTRGTWLTVPLHWVLRCER